MSLGTQTSKHVGRSDATSNRAGREHPRPRELIEAVRGGSAPDELDRLYEQALRDTIEQLEATGSPVITDGEQTKPSFATYPLVGLESLAPETGW